MYFFIEVQPTQTQAPFSSVLFRKKYFIDCFSATFLLLCLVHLSGQNIFSPGQNQICQRQNYFLQDKTCFSKKKLIKNNFWFWETLFKPWTIIFVLEKSNFVPDKNILCEQMDWALDFFLKKVLALSKFFVNGQCQSLKQLSDLSTWGFKTAFAMV